MEFIVKVLRNRVWVYSITALFLGVVASAFFSFFVPSIDKQSSVETQARNYQVSIISEQNIVVPECRQSRKFPFKVTCEQSRQLRKIVTPLYRLNITHPEKLYRNSTGEIKLTVVGLNLADQQEEENVENLVAEISVLSKHFTFLPESNAKIALTIGNSQILHFDAKGKEAEGSRKILVQSKLEQSIEEFPKLSEWSRESIDIEVIPPAILFGLSESTVEGIRVISAGLGLPALLLFLVTFLFNRWRDKKEKNERDSVSRIIMPK